MANSHTERYLDEAKGILERLDRGQIEALVACIHEIRAEKGRIFFLGVGGSAANASHAVNDFRKICGIECYTPTDNVAELTARINDDGWDTSFSNWLKGSALSGKDMLFILSVGGGNLEKKVSVNLVKALQYGQEVGAKIVGIVGRDGGYTARVADACVIIPTMDPASVTPHTEAFQAVIWHLLVSHPVLLKHTMKWEAVK